MTLIVGLVALAAIVLVYRYRPGRVHRSRGPIDQRNIRDVKRRDQGRGLPY